MLYAVSLQLVKTIDNYDSSTLSLEIVEADSIEEVIGKSIIKNKTANNWLGAYKACEITTKKK